MFAHTRGRRVHAHVLHQHVLAVDHLPVPRQHQVVADPVHQRDNRLALRERRHGAALEAIAAVDQEGAFRVLPPQRGDHRAQGGEPASALEDRTVVLVEELVVNVELRVDVGGLQDGDVLRLARLHGRTAGHRRRFGLPLQAERRDRTEAEAEAHRTGMPEELAPIGEVPCLIHRLGSRVDATCTFFRRASSRFRCQGVDSLNPAVYDGPTLVTRETIHHLPSPGVARSRGTVRSIRPLSWRAPSFARTRSPDYSLAALNANPEPFHLPSATR